jgi:hypothetical protein
MIKPISIILISLLLVGCHAGSRKKMIKAEQKPAKKYEITLRPDGYPTPDAFVTYEEAPEIINQPMVICPVVNNYGGKVSVWVNALIDTTGHVVDVNLLKGHTPNNDGCEDYAIENAFGTIWKPALSSGKPVALWVSYKIVFSK